MDKRKQKRIIQAVISLALFLVIGLLQKQGIIVINPSPVKQAATTYSPGTYAVTKFDDGDTIVVDMEGKTETVRFIGVDTPETHDPRKPVQCFGKAAAAHTKELIGDSRVRLEADPTNANRDRYRRLLRYIYLPNGTLVNKKIIEDGYGFALTAFPFTKMEEFRQAQKEARAANRGLWADCKIDTSSGHNQTSAE